MEITQLLYQKVAAVCPIDGVSIGVQDDKSTWRIDFHIAASDDQKAAANTVLGNFNMLRETLLDALAAYRYEVQTGGISIDGIAVKTDEVSTSKLIAAWIKAQKNIALTVTWINGNTAMVINAATITALGDAVFDFEQKCYAVQGQVIADIDQYATVDEMQKAFDERMKA